jgi:conjugative transposon TraM protein
MKGKETPVSLLAKGGSNYSKGDKGGKTSSRRNGFYSLKEEQVASNSNSNAISAVVHETQVVVSGSAVKLRLTNEVIINGVLIPKDSFLFGTASLNGERLIIKINSIRFRNSLFPVDLSVYDLDGLAGIYIPGAITRDVARQSADRAVQDIGFSTFDPSLEVQAASAGVEVAKNLFSKKAKLVKVTVKAGYQVLLRDEKQI